MTDGKIRSLPIGELETEAGAQELVRSERMKPYLAPFKGSDGRAEHRTAFGCVSCDTA
jgi:hypothetical protein